MSKEESYWACDMIVEAMQGVKEPKEIIEKFKPLVPKTDQALLVLQAQSLGCLRLQEVCCALQQFLQDERSDRMHKEWGTNKTQATTLKPLSELF